MAHRASSYPVKNFLKTGMSITKAIPMSRAVTAMSDINQMTLPRAMVSSCMTFEPCAIVRPSARNANRLHQSRAVLNLSLSSLGPSSFIAARTCSTSTISALQRVRDIASKSSLYFATASPYSACASSLNRPGRFGDAITALAEINVDDPERPGFGLEAVLSANGVTVPIGDTAYGVCESGKIRAFKLGCRFSSGERPHVDLDGHVALRRFPKRP